jgi:hypothetical protein
MNLSTEQAIDAVVDLLRSEIRDGNGHGGLSWRAAEDLRKLLRELVICIKDE